MKQHSSGEYIEFDHIITGAREQFVNATCPEIGPMALSKPWAQFHRSPSTELDYLNSRAESVVQ